MRVGGNDAADVTKEKIMSTQNATYLVEFYVKSGDILFARTVATSEGEAVEKVRANWPVSFDDVITCDEVSADFLPDCECTLIG